MKFLVSPDISLPLIGSPTLKQFRLVINPVRDELSHEKIEEAGKLWAFRGCPKGSDKEVRSS